MSARTAFLGALRALIASAALAGWVSPAHAANADAPEPWVRATPRYPDEAQPYRIPADCRARFDLTPAGEPTNVCVHCEAAAVPDAFEREVVDALHAWRYPPENSYGPPIQREGLTIEIPFALRNPPWSLNHGEAVEPPACGPGGVS